MVFGLFEISSFNGSSKEKQHQVSKGSTFNLSWLQVDAFWCFVGLMERMAGNFAQDQAGMHTQLAALRQLVQVRLAG